MTERRCIISRCSLDKAHAIRLVIAPNGHIMFDLKGKLPGRGYWIAANKDIISELQTNRKKRQQIFGAAILSEDFHACLEAGLKNYIIQQIGLARRAGLVCFGFEKIKEWMKTHKAALALIASDASKAETKRLRIKQFGCPFFGLLSGKELGMAFSRSYIAYMVFNSSNLTENIYNNNLRLQGLWESNI